MPGPGPFSPTGPLGVASAISPAEVQVTLKRVAGALLGVSDYVPLLRVAPQLPSNQDWVRCRPVGLRITAPVRTVPLMFT